MLTRKDGSPVSPTNAGEEILEAIFDELKAIRIAMTTPSAQFEKPEDVVKMKEPVMPELRGKRR